MTLAQNPPEMFALPQRPLAPMATAQQRVETMGSTLNAVGRGLLGPALGVILPIAFLTWGTKKLLRGIGVI